MAYYTGLEHLKRLTPTPCKACPSHRKSQSSNRRQKELQQKVEMQLPWVPTSGGYYRLQFLCLLPSDVEIPRNTDIPVSCAHSSSSSTGKYLYLYFFLSLISKPRNWDDIYKATLPCCMGEPAFQYTYVSRLQAQMFCTPQTRTASSTWLTYLQNRFILAHTQNYGGRLEITW